MQGQHSIRGNGLLLIVVYARFPLVLAPLVVSDVILEDFVHLAQLGCLERFGPDSFVPFKRYGLDKVLVLLLLLMPHCAFTLQSRLQPTIFILQVGQMLVEILLLLLQLLRMLFLSLPRIQTVILSVQSSFSLRTEFSHLRSLSVPQ